jgi:hypothetical protein
MLSNFIYEVKYHIRSIYYKILDAKDCIVEKIKSVIAMSLQVFKEKPKHTSKSQNKDIMKIVNGRVVKLRRIRKKSKTNR